MYCATFRRIRQVAEPRAKYDVYNCLVEVVSICQQGALVGLPRYWHTERLHLAFITQWKADSSNDSVRIRLKSRRKLVIVVLVIVDCCYWTWLLTWGCRGVRQWTTWPVKTWSDHSSVVHTTWWPHRMTQRPRTPASHDARGPIHKKKSYDKLRKNLG